MKRTEEDIELVMHEENTYMRILSI